MSSWACLHLGPLRIYTVFKPFQAFVHSVFPGLMCGFMEWPLEAIYSCAEYWYTTFEPPEPNGPGGYKWNFTQIRNRANHALAHRIETFDGLLAQFHGIGCQNRAALFGHLLGYLSTVLHQQQINAPQQKGPT